MIAFLNGILAEKSASSIIVDVGGVGYQIGVSTQTLSVLPETGKPLKLHIYHHFTESEQRLFGFLSLDEKSLFEKLITVKSIGPKLALGILSGLPYDQLIDAIRRHDAISLSRVPGIGKKTAERIVLELADKLTSIGSDVSGTTEVSGLAANETLSALEALGYRRNEAQQAIQRALKESPDAGKDVSTLLKSSLRMLSK
jgi:Holliday junction DNA helicase RuvA